METASNWHTQLLEFKALTVNQVICKDCLWSETNERRKNGVSAVKSIKEKNKRSDPP